MGMMVLLKKFIILAFLATMYGCGADKLNPKILTNSNGLSAANSCQCTSDNSPVCSNDGIDYVNSCLANCYGKTVKATGHCDCATNPVKVCGIDGLDHTECEAKNSNIQIIKFSPCAAKEL